MKTIQKSLQWFLVMSGLLLLGLNPAKADLPVYPLDSSTNVTILGTAVIATNQYPDTIGLTALHAITTNLNGSGILVGQPEAELSSGSKQFEVNPTSPGLPVNHFTYWYASQSATNFPNSIGAESTHADAVADSFYGMQFGVATNVAHVSNIDANYIYGMFIYDLVPGIGQVINQSYTYGNYYSANDYYFDNYAATYNVLFVSGAGLTNQPVYSPATCYNGIAVGVYNSPWPPYGPTQDGRSKPDITAWGNVDSQTSYSTPIVSGAATLLLQAATRGDGGTNVTAATDIRTIKALLLNGAVKPVGWTNSTSVPLHTTYGAGLVNVLNSYEQLVGGHHAYSTTENIVAGADHTPGEISDAYLSGFTGSNQVLRGWDFNTISNSSSTDAVNDYYFAVTNAASANYTATATLVWNRQVNQWYINNLGLFLYNVDNGQLINCSTSIVDNVQHIYTPVLPPGHYDLQVWMPGNTPVSPTETYALAYEFYSVAAQAAGSGTNLVISWPLYPSGFAVQGSTNVLTPNWITLTNLTPAIVNGQYQVTVPSYNPNALSLTVQTNNGSSGGPGLPGGPSSGSTNVAVVPVYNNNIDLHFFRLTRPNM